MARGDAIKFDAVPGFLAGQDIDIEAGAWKVALLSAGFDVVLVAESNPRLGQGNLTEVTAGGGYAAGGIAVTLLNTNAAGNAFLESILGGLLGGLAGGVGGGGRAASAGTSIPGGIGGFAKGDAFAPGGALARNIKEFARGGIVDTPEAFAFADGLGIMGEAGPEAILPLARMGDGRLGVLAQVRELKERLAPPAAGAAPVSLAVTINAPGADREGLARVERKIDELRTDLVRVNGSIERRAVRAWLETRRRGGFR